MTIKIFSPEQQTVHPKIEFPEFSFPYIWDKESYVTQEDLAKKAQGYDIVVINKLHITERELSELPNLKMVAMLATGYNNIDVDACRRHHVALANIQGYGTESVAEHAMGLILSVAKNLNRYNDLVKNKSWSNSGNFCLMYYPLFDLKGKKLLIIGNGAIGKRLSEIAAKGFGMEILLSARKNAKVIPEGRVDFYEGLKLADVISVNCPLNTETLNLISNEEFAVMKKDALIINTARGGIINEEALAHALTNDLIAGAATDTVSKEPIPKESPLLPLLNTKNLIITPHCAWLSDIAIKNIGIEFVKNIEAFVKRERRNRID